MHPLHRRVPALRGAWQVRSPPRAPPPARPSVRPPAAAAAGAARSRFSALREEPEEGRLVAVILLSEPCSPSRTAAGPRRLPRAARSCCTPALPLFPPCPPRPGAAPRRTLPLPPGVLRRDATPSPPFSDAFVPTSLSLRKDQVLLHGASPFLLPPHLSPHWQTCCCTLAQGFAGDLEGQGGSAGAAGAGSRRRCFPVPLLPAPSLPAPAARLCCGSPCPRPSPRRCGCVSPSPGPALPLLRAALSVEVEEGEAGTGLQCQEDPSHVSPAVGLRGAAAQLLIPFLIATYVHLSVNVGLYSCSKRTWNYLPAFSYLSFSPFQTFLVKPVVILFTPCFFFFFFVLFKEGTALRAHLCSPADFESLSFHLGLCCIISFFLTEILLPSLSDLFSEWLFGVVVIISIVPA